MISPEIHRMLVLLRQRIRQYVCVEGIGWTVASVGLLFWFSYVSDWLLHISREVRFGLLFLIGITMVYAFYRFVVSRLMVPLRDASLALVLERRFSDLNGSVMTSVELGVRQADSEFQEFCLRQAGLSAATRTKDIRVHDIFDYRPMVVGIGAAILFVVSIGCMGAVAPELLSIWFQRNVVLSNTPWPRQTELRVVGFEDGFERVAIGSDYQLLVEASTTMPIVPRFVDVEMRFMDGSKSAARMSRLNDQTSGTQQYVLTVRGIAQGVQLSIKGGDHQLDDLQLVAVPSPEVSRLDLNCSFPEYLDRAPETVELANSIELPEGSSLTFKVTPSQPVKLVQFYEDEKIRDIVQSRGTEQVSWSLVLDETVNLAISLTDKSDLQSQRPYAVHLVARRDQPPIVETSVTGVGASITAQCKIPFHGRIRDDYGIGKAEFRWSISDSEPRSIPIQQDFGSRRDVTWDERLDISTLGVTEGQELRLVLFAEDKCTIVGHQVESQSPALQWQVVSPAELRRQLEETERNLRQRFEALLVELRSSRDTITRLGRDEPGEELGEETKRNWQQLNELRAQQAAYTSAKNQDEVGDIRMSFDDVLQQIRNNQLDLFAPGSTAIGPDSSSRIADGIVAPLRAIEKGQFPEVVSVLDQIADLTKDKNYELSARNTCVAQMTLLISDLTAVLQSMLELEGYNELVESLRRIIAAQEELSRATQKRRTENAKKLLID